MAGKSRDLFDDSVMTFGEHLEALRTHLWRALIGVVIGTILCLIFGSEIIAVIRKPIDDQLRARSVSQYQAVDLPQNFSFWDSMVRWFKEQLGMSVGDAEENKKAETAIEEAKKSGSVQLKFKLSELVALLHERDPEAFPPPQEVENEEEVTLTVHSAFFARQEEAAERSQKPITLTVQEAFLTYLKVSFISGLVLSSPWVIYQLWLFVAAGLYAHERRYVYTYLPMSVGLFLFGILFCFYIVFPFILKFMLGFNEKIGVEPQIRLSEWISFAITLPVMFGISFQLPMVMLFLERISVFDVQAYRDKRRMAILTIAIIAMLLTPPDPVSMLSMMTPLVLLYEFGILLCKFSPSIRSPFEAEQPA